MAPAGEEKAEDGAPAASPVARQALSTVVATGRGREVPCRTLGAGKGRVLTPQAIRVVLGDGAHLLCVLGFGVSQDPP